VSAEVSDDGRGRRSTADTHDGAGGDGRGLSGLAERVGAIDGAAFEAGALPEGGFRLRIDLPLADVAASEAPA